MKSCRQSYLGQIFETKKTDWALSFSSRHPDVKLQYQALAADGKAPKLSQMNNDLTSKLVLYSAVEVKVPSGNESEAQAQLFTWFQAGVSRLRQLLKKIATGNGTLDSGPTLPLVGWTVIGTRWELYVAYGDGNDERDDVFVVGPFALCQCQLNNDFGVFKLLRLIDRVKHWGREYYWPWYCDTIIEPLKSIKGEPPTDAEKTAEEEDRQERES